MLVTKSDKMKKRKWIIIKWITVLVVFIITITLIANIIIETRTNNLVYNEVNNIPHNKTGLLLGTSKYLKSGQPNRYFANRIKAAVELYNAKKIDFIVVSGDNNSIYDNEPLDMKNELMKYGVPEKIIYLDYAGFRTYDSVVRVNYIFGQTHFTVISQEFHNRRAIYIANRLGLHAIGFNAENVDAYNGFKTNLREKFSRVKVFIDLCTGKKPKFLGEKIKIK